MIYLALDQIERGEKQNLSPYSYRERDSRYFEYLRVK